MTPVELFIIEQPKQLRPVYRKLRGIILNEIPQIQEKIVYGIPFFYLKKRVFFFAPKKKGMDLGFCDGFLLAKHPLLEVKNRSRVRTIYFDQVEKIEESTLIPFLHEAVLVHNQGK